MQTFCSENVWDTITSLHTLNIRIAVHKEEEVKYRGPLITLSSTQHFRSCFIKTLLKHLFLSREFPNEKPSFPSTGIRGSRAYQGSRSRWLESRKRYRGNGSDAVAARELSLYLPNARRLLHLRRREETSAGPCFVPDTSRRSGCCGGAWATGNSPSHIRVPYLSEGTFREEQHPTTKRSGGGEEGRRGGREGGTHTPRYTHGEERTRGGG